jgi:hypothetical protein
MSGGLGGVKKVFKKVAKTVSKVLPVALGVGAIVFSAGSALGALPTWGSAVSSLTGSGSTLGNILTGAVTQAGYGAAAGMAVAAVTGGDVVKGAQYGGAAGAVTGGITGAMQPTGPVQAGPSQGGVPGPSQATPTAGPGLAIQTASAPAAAAAPNVTGAAPGLLAPGGWLERNQELVGGVVSGVGKGLLESAAADDAGKSEIQILRERQRLINANYGKGNVGLLGPGSTDYIQNISAQRIPYRYAYNPESGMIEEVATA